MKQNGGRLEIRWKTSKDKTLKIGVCFIQEIVHLFSTSLHVEKVDNFGRSVQKRSYALALLSREFIRTISWCCEPRDAGRRFYEPVNLSRTQEERRGKEDGKMMEDTGGDRVFHATRSRTLVLTG